MKVSELKTILESLPEDHDIFIYTEGYGTFSVTSVDINDSSITIESIDQ